jgi:antitoxin CptB
VHSVATRESVLRGPEAAERATASELERLRWWCRRGMLELDLVLARFAERHLERLDAPSRAAFAELLGRPDPELLDLVLGRAEPEERLRPLVALLREGQASCST